MSNQTLRNARRVTFRVKSDMIDQFLSAVREGYHSSLRSQPGVRRIYLFQSPEVRNEFLSLSLWNPPGNSEAESFASLMEPLKDFLEAPPAVVEFDVVHHEVNEELPPPEEAVKKVRRTTRKPTARRKKTSAKSKKRKVGRKKRS
jgi:quinol monooxygenase YgiN